MSAVDELEASLARVTGRAAAIATGRAATAIWITLEALHAMHPARRKVILPATLCTSPPAVTRLAGLEPVFCDVQPATGNLDPIALRSLIARHPDALCVMAAHLYGQPCEIEAIARTCRTADIPLIEDAAQAWGAAKEGRAVGGFGTISIVSFGHTKPLDAGGGGAALTDDPDLAAALRALGAGLPEKPAAITQWSADYRSGYYALAPAFAERPGLKAMIGHLCTLNPGLYRYRLDEAQATRILAVLPGTTAAVAHRRAIADLYDAQLDPQIARMTRHPDGVPWRFGLRVSPSLRDNALRTLRAAGFDASSWYPCVAPFFGAGPVSHWPAAAALERSIVNLWVDESVDAEKAVRTARQINEVLAQSSAQSSAEVAQ